MFIGGFQKNSLIDFPETISCVVFTQGCNFFCPYCHNPDLVAGPSKGPGPVHDESRIISFLERRKDLLDGVVITGGEPTLQKDLVNFCRKIKKMGFKLKLDTNGTRPDILETLLKEKLTDYVAMDIKTSPEQYHLVTSGKTDIRNIEKSIFVIMDSAPAYEFRTTCLKPFIDRHIAADIAQMIKNAALYILQPCSKNVSVLNPEITDVRENFFSTSRMEELKTIISPFVKECRIR